MLQYNTHTWGFIGHANPALYHACSSTLSRLDSVQTSFVQHLGLNEEEAFNDFIPPAVRRDIAMLGLLYKIAHNIAAPALMDLFPHQPNMDFRRTRRSSVIHDMQFVVQNDGTQMLMYARSMFGLVKCWNALQRSSALPPFLRFSHCSLVLLNLHVSAASKTGSSSSHHFVSQRFVHFCYDALEA